MAGQLLGMGRVSRTEQWWGNRDEGGGWSSEGRGRRLTDLDVDTGLEQGLSGAKLEREETAWGAVLAEILSVAPPDSPCESPFIWGGGVVLLPFSDNKIASRIIYL